jgi:hypothetical protein
MPGEEYLFQIGAEVPGFGGMYYDDDGDLVILLKDLRLSRQAAAAVRRHLPGPGKRGRQEGPPAEIRFRQAEYSFVELNGYWQRINQVVVEIPGVVSTDVDEVSNRVVVGVRRAAVAQEVRRALTALPIPEGSVQVQTIEPCTSNDPNCPPTGAEEPEPFEGEELPPAPELPADDTAGTADGSVAPDAPRTRSPEAELPGRAQRPTQAIVHSHSPLSPGLAQHPLLRARTSVSIS